jgi:ABC-2 type transport system permease protein
MLWAILYAQLLSMRPRKGRALRGGAVFSVFTTLIFYSVFAFFGFSMELLFSNADMAGRFGQLLSGVLLLMTGYWQIAPVVTASFGASIDLRKLMAYPVPRRELFLVEALLRAMTSFDMLLVLGGITIGLLRNPLYGWRAAPYVVGGAAAFAAMNVLLSAGVKSWMERFFVRTRFKEVFFLIVVLALVSPQLFLLTNTKVSGLLRFVPSQMVWPWSAISGLMLREKVLPGILMAAAWIAVALLFSRRQFAKMLVFDGPISSRKEKNAAPDRLSERLFRLPSRFLPDPIAALIEKEMRTLTRISRFRMAYGMSCFFGVLLVLPSLRRGGGHSPFLNYALPVMAVYGLLMLGQLTFWNSLGFDRSAAQGYFCWPVRFRDALIAKNVSVMVLLIPQVALVTVIARAFHVPASPGKILETIVVDAIAALFWFGLGNISSVRMPRAMNPEKMNQMANKLQSLTILVAPVVLLPVVLAYWARAVFESEVVFAGTLAIAAALGGIFYWVALDSAVKTATERREVLLQELSRADGPISTT